MVCFAGQSTVNIYENDNPVLFNSDLQIYESNSIDTKFWRLMKSYNYLEPRYPLPTKSTMTNL
jgi:hypothetical protein